MRPLREYTRVRFRRTIRGSERSGLVYPAGTEATLMAPVSPDGSTWLVEVRSDGPTYDCIEVGRDDVEVAA